MIPIGSFKSETGTYVTAYSADHTRENKKSNIAGMIRKLNKKIPQESPSNPNLLNPSGDQVSTKSFQQAYFVTRLNYVILITNVSFLL